MPFRMTIRIRTDETQTISRFAVDAGGKVTIHNHAAAQLSVKFKGESPFCQQTGNQIPSFNIAPGQYRRLTVCDGADGKEFRYAATVANSPPGESVLVVEKNSVWTEPIFFPDAAPALAAGFVAGVVVTVAIVKLLPGRRA